MKEDVKPCVTSDSVTMILFDMIFCLTSPSLKQILFTLVPNVFVPLDQRSSGQHAQ